MSLIYVHYTKELWQNGWFTNLVKIVILLMNDVMLLLII